MNLRKKLKKLEKENIMLKLENLKLKLKLRELNSEWQFINMVGSTGNRLRGNKNESSNFNRLLYTSGY